MDTKTHQTIPTVLTLVVLLALLTMIFFNPEQWADGLNNPIHSKVKF